MLGRGCALGKVWLPSNPSTIYRGKGEGAGPLEPIWWEGRRPGRVACPPSQGGRPLQGLPHPEAHGP